MTDPYEDLFSSLHSAQRYHCEFCSVPSASLRSLSKNLSLQKHHGRTVPEKMCTVCIQGRDSVQEVAQRLAARKWSSISCCVQMAGQSLSHRMAGCLNLFPLFRNTKDKPYNTLMNYFAFTSHFHAALSLLPEICS